MTGKPGLDFMIRPDTGAKDFVYLRLTETC